MSSRKQTSGNFFEARRFCLRSPLPRIALGTACCGPHAAAPPADAATKSLAARRHWTCSRSAPRGSRFAQVSRWTIPGLLDLAAAYWSETLQQRETQEKLEAMSSVASPWASRIQAQVRILERRGEQPRCPKLP